jgi:hypothetical protein
MVTWGNILRNGVRKDLLRMDRNAMEQEKE